MSAFAEALVAVADLESILARKPKRLTLRQAEEARRLPTAIAGLMRTFVTKPGWRRRPKRDTSFDYPKLLKSLTMSFGADEAARIIDGFADISLGSEFAVTVSRILAHLTERMPRVPSRKPDPVDLERFKRLYLIAEYPLVALEKMCAGTMTLQDAQAFGAMYPELQARAQDALIRQVMARKMKDENWRLPWEKQGMAAMLLGIPLYTPERIQRLQAQVKSAQPQQKAPPPAAPKSIEQLTED